MIKRFEITKGAAGALFNKATTGHGNAGQVKKAGHFGRSIKVQGQRLNAGSLVDFLNNHPESDKQLKKGWFFGYGGSSNKEIKAVFNSIFHANESNNVDDIPSTQSSTSSQSDRLQDEKEAVLEAVKQNGLKLKDASEAHKDDEDIVLAAVKQTPFALEYASDRLKNDRAFVRKAMKPHAF